MVGLRDPPGPSPPAGRCFKLQAPLPIPPGFPLWTRVYDHVAMLEVRTKPRVKLWGHSAGVAGSSLCYKMEVPVDFSFSRSSVVIKTLPGTCWVNTRSITLNILRGSTGAPQQHVLGLGVSPFANLAALGAHSLTAEREVDLEPLRLLRKLFSGPMAGSWSRRFAPISSQAPFNVHPQLPVMRDDHLT